MAEFMLERAVRLGSTGFTTLFLLDGRHFFQLFVLLGDNDVHMTFLEAFLPLENLPIVGVVS